MVPTYGIVWCCFTVKGHRLWDGLLGGSANGPQIWDKCPGWVGVMPQRSPSMGVPHARSTKGPQIWDAEPGWYGLMPPKVTVYGMCRVPRA